MSILNTHVAPDRALVAVDTACGVAGMAGEASKLAYLAHANVVLAARGEVLTFGLLVTALNMAMLPDFDCMVERLGDALSGVFVQREEFNQANCGTYPFAGLEVACVGYSNALQRMDGLRIERWPLQSAWKTTRIDPWSLSPNPGYMPDHAPDSEARMIAVAHDQLDAMRGLPQVKAGGKLVLAEITQHGVSIRKVADLNASGLKTAA